MFCIVMRRGLTIVVRLPVTGLGAARRIETTSNDSFFSAAGCCAAMVPANANIINTALPFPIRTFLPTRVILGPNQNPSNNLKDTWSESWNLVDAKMAIWLARSNVRVVGIGYTSEKHSITVQEDCDSTVKPVYVDSALAASTAASYRKNFSTHILPALGACVLDNASHERLEEFIRIS